jgi:hypothetical protein
MASSTPTSSYNAAFAAVPKPNAAPNKSLVPTSDRIGKFSGLTLFNAMTMGAEASASPGHPYQNPNAKGTGTTGPGIANPPVFPGTYGGIPKGYTHGGQKDNHALYGQPNRIGLLRGLDSFNNFYTLYFMFNPNEIEVSFDINQQSIPANYIYGDSIQGAGNTTTSNSGQSALNNNFFPNLVNAVNVSWSLIFDRTYDLAFNNANTNQRGVLDDVGILYNLMGAFTNSGAVPMSTPVEVVFAQNGSGQLWGFTGFISAVDITYGIFRYNMVPSRCEIDLTMTAVAVAPSVPAAAGSGSTTTTTTTKKKQPAKSTTGPISSFTFKTQGSTSAVAQAKAEQQILAAQGYKSTIVPVNKTTTKLVLSSGPGSPAGPAGPASPT